MTKTLQDLIQEHRSLLDIPEAELESLGYLLKQGPDGVRIVRKDVKQSEKTGPFDTVKFAVREKSSSYRYLSGEMFHAAARKMRYIDDITDPFKVDQAPMYANEGLRESGDTPQWCMLLFGPETPYAQFRKEFVKLINKMKIRPKKGPAEWSVHAFTSDDFFTRLSSIADTDQVTDFRIKRKDLETAGAISLSKAQQLDSILTQLYAQLTDEPEYRKVQEALMKVRTPFSEKGRETCGALLLELLRTLFWKQGYTMVAQDLVQIQDFSAVEHYLATARLDRLPSYERKVALETAIRTADVAGRRRLSGRLKEVKERLRSEQALLQGAHDFLAPWEKFIPLARKYIRDLQALLKKPGTEDAQLEYTL